MMLEARATLSLWTRFLGRVGTCKYTSIPLFASEMDAKYCSQCVQKLPISSFLANAFANLGTKVFSTCITCRARSKKRRALQPLDPNIPSKRRAKIPTRSDPPIPPTIPVESPPESSILPPPPELCLETLIPISVFNSI